MSSVCVLDIETIGNSSLMNCLPAPEVKAGNLKDPEKIAAKEAEARQKQIDSMALSPLWGRVCAWVLATDDEDTFTSVLAEDTDAAETELLEKLFVKIRRHCLKLVTFNGSKFDLPFIYKRALILGIDTREYGLPALRDLTDRYSDFHTDLMLAWCGYGEYESLENLASRVLGSHKIEVDFRDFPEMIKTEKGRAMLAAYCRQDVALTVRLYNRFSGILF